MRSSCRVILLLVIVLATCVLAQTPPPKASAPPAQTQATATPIVPSGQVVTAYTLPPDKLAKATALYTVRVRLLFIDAAYTLAVLLIFLFAWIAPAFRNAAERVFRRRWLQVLVFAPLFLITMDLLELPLDLYRQNLQRGYGLSVQTWGSWFGDWGKGVAIDLILGIIFLSILYAVIRRSPTRWWFYFWLCAIPILLFLFYIGPVVIQPMFNHFEPLAGKQPQLVTEIEKVVHRGGLDIPRDRMFEMRASDKVTTMNAYVTGFGATKRVVVWDNTPKYMTTPQTLFVFGHEMGHYVLGHVWKLLGFLAVLLFVLFWLAYLLSTWMVRRWGQRWGIREMGDWASFPVLMLVFFILSTLTSPVTVGISRHYEHQADIYGLEVVHGIVPDQKQAAAGAFQALGEKALSYPTPGRFMIFWTYDHPAIGDRVNFAVGYDPWSKGESPEFVK